MRDTWVTISVTTGSDLMTSERRLDDIAAFDWDDLRIGARACCHYSRID
jgi:hypothetical protein